MSLLLYLRVSSRASGLSLSLSLSCVCVCVCMSVCISLLLLAMLKGLLSGIRAGVVCVCLSNIYVFVAMLFFPQGSALWHTELEYWSPANSKSTSTAAKIVLSQHHRSPEEKCRFIPGLGVLNLCTSARCAQHTSAYVSISRLSACSP